VDTAGLRDQPDQDLLSYKDKYMLKSHCGNEKPRQWSRLQPSKKKGGKNK